MFQNRPNVATAESRRGTGRSAPLAGDDQRPKRRAALARQISNGIEALLTANQTQLREALQTFTERTRVELVLDEGLDQALKYLERWCVAQG